ncbi:hypothetical protein [Sporosarcina cyprini]|uniref:hypothetical protein n=1 Tax=Sporosarcina cyprini TaxID=2910523 RepID=UPI001EDFB19F|nr:hypothetical protein [Sporosarcina cyprini]MCG3086427.1 hypothetical protein [Sporosarcina cyprini]
MGFVVTVLASFLAWRLYERIAPISGASCVDEPPEQTAIIDVRDYQLADHEPFEQAVNIPFAYLKRNLEMIPGKQVHIIADNSLNRNLSIRYLRRKGYGVTSYTLTECPCKSYSAPRF